MLTFIKRTMFLSFSSILINHYSSSLIFSEYCYDNPDCSFSITKRPTPETNRKYTTVNFEIRLYRNPPPFAGDMVPCVIKKKMILNMNAIKIDTSSQCVVKKTKKVLPPFIGEFQFYC